MLDNVKLAHGQRMILSDDEVAVVEFCRALQLDRGEALKRLATSNSSPILPIGQELQSNFAAVARDLLAPEQTADHPTQP